MSLVHLGQGELFGEIRDYGTGPFDYAQGRQSRRAPSTWSAKGFGFPAIARPPMGGDLQSRQTASVINPSWVRKSGAAVPGAIDTRRYHGGHGPNRSGRPRCRRDRCSCGRDRSSCGDLCSPLCQSQPDQGRSSARRSQYRRNCKTHRRCSGSLGRAEQKRATRKPSRAVVHIRIRT